jgi:hypothetical protein
MLEVWSQCFELVGKWSASSLGGGSCRCGFKLSARTVGRARGFVLTSCLPNYPTSSSLLPSHLMPDDYCRLLLSDRQHVVQTIAEAVGYVVGLQGEVGDPDAISFTREFYRGYCQAFPLTKAIHQAQSVVRLTQPKFRAILFRGARAQDT